LKAIEQQAYDTERSSFQNALGIIEPDEKHTCKPLALHLTDYSAHQQQSSGTTEYTNKPTYRIEAMLRACNFVKFADMGFGRVTLL
jgi:hypothetical protein